MTKWKMEFFPKSGVSTSPKDFIIGLDSKREKALIYEHLKTIAQQEPKDWPNHKMIRGVDQLTVGDFRIYMFIDGDLLVVCYICRKVSQQAKSQDLDRAVKNKERYFQEKEDNKE